MRHRSVLSAKLFTIIEKGWLHLRPKGWRTGAVASICSPTTVVEFSVRLYPTHETRVRLHFRDYSISPPLNAEQLLYDLPESGPSSITVRPAPLFELLNPQFASYIVSETTWMTLKIPGSSYALFIKQLDTFDIDSDTVLLIVTRVIVDNCSL